MAGCFDKPRVTLRACSPGKHAVAIEDRLIDIELKLTAQEDLTQSLSQQVYRQQKLIDELRALCGMLLRRLDDVGGSDPHAQEKPPHY